MGKKKITSPKVGIEIFNAKALSFSVNSELKSEKEISPKDVTILLNAEFRVDETNSRIAIKLSFDIVMKESKQNLFSIESFFEFGVSELKEVYVKKGKSNELAPDFARKILNIAIGGSRGMLSVYLSSTPYSYFTLPIANIPDEFFEI